MKCKMLYKTKTFKNKLLLFGQMIKIKISISQKWSKIVKTLIEQYRPC